jgi:hypothetical protein
VKGVVLLYLDVYVINTRDRAATMLKNNKKIIFLNFFHLPNAILYDLELD